MNSSGTDSGAHRRPSRSNSVSSSINTAIKKSASLSRPGTRTSFLRGRSASPDSITRVLNSLNNPSSDVRNVQDNADNKKTANAFNVNRWSHSTSSSISGIEAELSKQRNSTSSSVRRSMAGITNGNVPNMETSYSSPRKGHSKRKSSSVDGSRLNFQDSSNLNIVRDLSQPTTRSTAADVPSSKWEARTTLNKFGDPVQGMAMQYNASPAPMNSAPVTSTTFDQNDQVITNKFYRHRDRNKLQSKDISQSSIRSDHGKGKGRRSPRQKDMLSRALAKANTAVLLDNAQNIVGAVEAYHEACGLLEQVLVGSSDAEDRRKLSEIRETYSNRIAELHDLDTTFADLLEKDLPREPAVGEDNPESFYQQRSSFQARAANDVVPSIQLPLRQESLLPQIFGGDEYLQDQPLLGGKPSAPSTHLNTPMDAKYMPSPLSPRNPIPSQLPQTRLQPPSHRLPNAITPHSTGAGPTFWLDNTEGSQSSKSSRISSVDYDSPSTHVVSDIQADFDAAMNAAVDAAYDDEDDDGPDHDDEEIPEPTPRNIGQAFSESAAQDPLEQPTPTTATRFNHIENRYLDNGEEEEERMLEELTREFGLTDTQADAKQDSTMPRESGSSGFSGRTWGSSVMSTAHTSGTALSTLTETAEPASLIPPVQPPPPAPTQTRTSGQNSQTSRPASTDKQVPIRDRRMSGQSAKQLKIDTFPLRTTMPRPSMPPMPPSIELPKQVSQESTTTVSGFAPLGAIPPLTPLTSLQTGDSWQGESPITPALTQTGSIDENGPSSPLRSTRTMAPPAPMIRKNVSSTSLHNGGLSINASTDMLDLPSTPGSGVLAADIARRPSTSNNHPVTPGGHIVTASGALGGMYLFEDPTMRPSSSRSLNYGGPELAQLEACPESFLLRPFWLMRSLSTAFTHPQGGYVTQKLFISRDIWRVKNVKLKAVDEKIAACDLLTAALQALAKVDNFDATATLEEVQGFEGTLDQVRSLLSKKLGNEVGLAGASQIFKNTPAGEDTTESMPSKSSNTTAKSFTSGWRKLRSKSSSANLNANSNSGTKDSSHNFTMSSLPMTTSSSVATSRSYLNKQRNHSNGLNSNSQLPFSTPHAAYMSSLARLFDAVQVLDSIARQVEDPGLKYSSQTHVGLELSVRNAAEFFAFYIIRFVMSDLLMLTDKFLKRGSEWVMT